MSHHELDCPKDYLWISNGDGTFWHIHRDRLSDLACGSATPRNKMEMLLVAYPRRLEFYLDHMSGDYTVIIPAGRPLPRWNPAGFNHQDYLWVLRDDGTWLLIDRDRLADLASGDAAPVNETEEFLVQNPEWLNYLYRVRQRRLPDDDCGERAVADTFARIEVGERPTAADIKRRLKAAKPPKPEKPAHQEASEQRQQEVQDPKHAEGEENRNTASQAVTEILIACLGDRLGEVVELLEVADLFRVHDALREEQSRLAEQEASAGTASIPSSDQAPCTGSVTDLQEIEYDDTDDTAPPSDADVVVESGTVGEEAPSVEDSAGPDLTKTSDAATAEATDAPWSAGMPVNEPVAAVQATFTEVTENPLEAAFAALSPEQQAIDRNYVMRRLALEGKPPTDPSRFLQLYLDASEAERRAFRAGRAAETIQQAA